MELLFVAGHDANDAIFMEIPGQILHFQATQSEFFHRELEKGRIVGLVVDLAAFFDDTAVLIQESAVGQTALGILLSGPGIGEIDKQAIDLAAFKDLLDFFHIHIDVEYILKTHSLGLFHGHNHSFPATLHSDQQYIGICFSSFCSKLTLAAANFHPQGSCIGLQRTPVALQCSRLGDAQVAAAIHTAVTILHFSHSHIRFLQESFLVMVLLTQFRTIKTRIVKGNDRIIFGRCVNVDGSIQLALDLLFLAG